MWMLNNVGESTEHCGTPVEQFLIDDNVPFSLTCWVLPSRKLLVHIQKLLLKFIRASLFNNISWSAKSKAFLKSMNNAWIPDLPWWELSVELNHGCVIHIRADTVDRPLVNPCWMGHSVRSFWLSWSWFLWVIFPICGRTNIYRKSLFMSLGALHNFLFRFE